MDSKNFDTCRFRSAGKETYGERWCCGESLREGYICFELSIHDLTPEICSKCKKFEPKIEKEDGEEEI